MDIKDMDFFRLEDRMLFEAAAAANIVAAADAVHDAADDGNGNEEEKHNNDLNVALFVAPEANDDVANTDVTTVSDIDAQAKDLVEGALPVMDGSISNMPVVNAATEANADVQVDAHHDFIEGTLHVDNTDMFTVDADADADHGLLGDLLANEDIDDNTDAVSINGAVAPIAAEHTHIDINTEADQADSDTIIGATRGDGRHVVSIDFNAHKTYDGTVEIGQDDLSLNIKYDGDGDAVSSSLVSYEDGVWTFSIDTPDDDFTIVLSDAHFAGRSAAADAEASLDIALQGDNLNLYTFVFENTSIDGSGSSISTDDTAIDGAIDKLALTITVNDTNVKYGNENAEGDFTTFKDVTLESALGTGNNALGSSA